MTGNCWIKHCFMIIFLNGMYIKRNVAWLSGMYQCIIILTLPIVNMKWILIKNSSGSKQCVILKQAKNYLLIITGIGITVSRCGLMQNKKVPGFPGLF